MGNKRNKIKKALSPTPNESQSSINSFDNEELVDDLLAQLDSKAAASGAAVVLKEISDNQPSKQSTKDRFKARMASLQPPHRRELIDSIGQKSSSDSLHFLSR